MSAGREFGCAECFAEDAERAGRWRLQGVCELVDESHFGVAIRQCPACGQRFVTIFTEFVDWVDGDDPQYWDRVPVTQAEAERIRGLEGRWH